MKMLEEEDVFRKCVFWVVLVGGDSLGSTKWSTMDYSIAGALLRACVL